MLKEWNDFYQNMLKQWTGKAQPAWFDFLGSESFLKWMKLFHIHFFDAKEKSENMMEKMLEASRIASKSDVNDMVDAQRLIIDMLEDLTTRLGKLEALVKDQKGGKK